MTAYAAMPSTGAVERTPAEWSRLLGVQVIEPDGWGPDSIFGERDWQARICRAEFLERVDVSEHRWLT